MLTIWRVMKGVLASRYYKNLIKYYKPGGGGPDDDFGESPDGMWLTTTNCISQWVGIGAIMLGLTGRVLGNQLEKLFAGYDPSTDKPLVQNAGSPNRQPCWDLVFSAPKSFSCLWARLEGDAAQELVDAHHEAVKDALAYAERHLAYSRVGKSGVNLELEHVSLVIPTFLDFVSRSLDPQLHTHAPVVNVGVRRVDGKIVTNALEMHMIYTFKMALGAHYRLSLAQRAIDLKYEVEIDADSWRIKGFKKHIESDKSTRRKQVLADMEAKGVFGAIEASKSALATRPEKPKSEVGSLGKLREGWQQDFDELGFSELDADALRTNKPPQNKKPVAIARAALKKLTSSVAHFSYSDAFYACLVEAAPFGKTPEDMEFGLDELINSELVFLGIDEGQPRFTTQATLNTERELLDKVKSLKSRPGAVAGTNIVNATIAKNRLTTPQQAGVIRELTSGTSSIRFLDGVAGCGKTSYVLNQVADSFKKSGFKILALAPTGRAASQIGDDIASLSEAPRTIASGLGDWSISPWNKTKHHLKELARQAIAAPLPFRHFSRKIIKPNKIQLGPKTVLIVDEASMIDTKTFLDLVRKVTKEGGTVIFAFDWMQLPAVQGVSPVAFLRHEETDVVSELDEIWRQNHDWQKEAVKALKNRQVKTAFDILKSHGCISESENDEARVDALVNDWTQFGIHAPHRSIVIADTNKKVDELNERCQQIRIDAGKINAKRFLTVRDTNPESGEVRRTRVHVSDSVYFTRNATKRYGVENGSRGTVRRIEGNNLVVRLSNDKIVNIPVREYANIRLGYATTDYRTQGGSVENVYIIPGNDIHSIYVSVSRAIENVKLFVTEYEATQQEDSEMSPLLSRLGRMADLRLATEFQLLKNPPLEPTSNKPASLPLGTPTPNRVVRQLPAGGKFRRPVSIPAQTQKSKSNIFLANILRENATAPESVDVSLPVMRQLKLDDAFLKAPTKTPNPNQRRLLDELPKEIVDAKQTLAPVSNQKLPIIPKPAESIPYSELTHEQAKEIGIPLMSLETRARIQNSVHHSHYAHPVSENIDAFKTPPAATPVNKIAPNPTPPTNVENQPKNNDATPSVPTEAASTPVRSPMADTQPTMKTTLQVTTSAIRAKIHREPIKTQADFIAEHKARLAKTRQRLKIDQLANEPQRPMTKKPMAISMEQLCRGKPAPDDAVPSADNRGQIATDSPVSDLTKRIFNQAVATVGPFLVLVHAQTQVGFKKGVAASIEFYKYLASQIEKHKPAAKQLAKEKIAIAGKLAEQAGVEIQRECGKLAEHLKTSTLPWIHAVLVNGFETAGKVTKSGAIKFGEFSSALIVELFELLVPLIQRIPIFLWSCCVGIVCFVATIAWGAIYWIFESIFIVLRDLLAELSSYIFSETTGKMLLIIVSGIACWAIAPGLLIFWAVFSLGFRVCSTASDPFTDLSPEDRQAFLRGWLEAGDDIRERKRKADRFTPSYMTPLPDPVQTSSQSYSTTASPSTTFTPSLTALTNSNVSPPAQPQAYSIDNPMSSYAPIQSQLNTPTPAPPSKTATVETSTTTHWIHTTIKNSN